MQVDSQKSVGLHVAVEGSSLGRLRLTLTSELLTASTALKVSCYCSEENSKAHDEIIFVMEGVELG